MKYTLAGLAILAAQEVLAAPAVVERSSVPVSSNTVSLVSVNGTTGSSQALHAMVAANGTPLSSVGGEAYSVQTTLGGQTFPLLFDTGSSDLWVAQTNFQCLGANGKPKPAKYCDLGPKFSGKYTGGQIKGKKFFIEYGTGEVYGSLGYESVTLAGVNVPKQEISSAIKGFFQGDGVSGIFGFAYNDLTSQYPGQPGTPAKPAQNEPYSNWIYNAIASKKVSPLFTVVLERGSGAGSTLTLGGVPSAYSGLSYATTPIQIKKITPIKGEATHFSYYTITPKGISVNGVSTSTSTPSIVDTGTTLLYLPAAQAAAINAGYTPPATYDSAAGLYIVPCSATAPKFGVEIGSGTFYVSPKDLLIPANSAGTVCVSGVQSSGADFGILGDVFLKNVIAVFDRGAAEMKFAAHENY